MTVNFKAPGQSGWIVFYDGPGITVTSWYVQNSVGRYPAGMPAGARRVHVRTHPARTVALVAGAAALALAALVRPTTLPAALLLAALGVTAGLVIDKRRSPRRMELWVTYRGGEVELFSGADRREFEQVRRAVIRALEINRDPLAG
ncbi:DUF6232 family protein [Actinoplanes sp. NPDC051494]|uniref:DUF6232 family protein n=1 Tax=Actinoplanes sp. NPDC051494 TaxID=3363907 RepID=UPI0037B4AC4A